MIRNIDEFRFKKEHKGYGGDHSIPHHKNIISGKLVNRLKDGCNKNPTCEECPILVNECSGNNAKA